jgi:hypothetical protein
MENPVYRSSCVGKALPLIQGLGSLGLLAAGFTSLVLKAEPLLNWYYPIVWWGLIGLIDSLVLVLRGRSPIWRDPKEFLLLAGVSVPFWLFFEVYNLQIKNWYYVSASPTLWERWIQYPLAYATVLPAIFELKALMDAVGLFGRSGSTSTKRSLSRKRAVITMATLGIISMILPLVEPRIFFPLVWLGLFFLLDAYVYGAGEESVLRLWEMGNVGEILRLMAAGLLCGLLWESLNYPATTKWIYTVPYFEDIKVFEMPVAGYLGFSAFALECHVFWKALGLFRSKTLPALGARKSVRWARYTALVALVAGSLWVFHLLDTRTISSFHPTVDGLAHLAPQEATCLLSHGIKRLDLWVQKGTIPRNLTDCMSADTIERWLRWAQLASLRGIGTENLSLLLRAGIEDVVQLGRADPHLLWRRLKEIGKTSGPWRVAPTEAQVRIWVRAAKRAG